MPYINKPEREQYEEMIRNIVNMLRHKPIGHLNYVISMIFWKLFNFNRSYTYGNQLVGAIHCIAQEFYRRKLVPYEDEKIQSNGDIE